MSVRLHKMVKLLGGVVVVATSFFVTTLFLSYLALDTLEKDLVAYWSFDDTTVNWQTNSISDLARFKNHGKLLGMTKLMSQRPGKSREGLMFTQGAYIEIPEADLKSLDITKPFTLSVWIKTSNAEGHIFGAYGLSSDYPGFGIAISGGQIQYWSSANKTWVSAGGVNVSDGEWHHIVISVNSSSVSFYDNGSPLATQPTEPPGSYSGVRAIGARIDGSAPFSGVMDELKIFSLALTAADVKRLYVMARSSG